MNDHIHYDQVIARIQHFAESLKQKQLEKEALAIAIDDKEEYEADLRSQIKVCQEIMKEYFELFEEILYR